MWGYKVRLLPLISAVGLPQTRIMPSRMRDYLTELEQNLVSSPGYSIAPIDPQISVHRLVFAPAFNAPSLVEFKLGTADSEVLLVIPTLASNTATVGGWQGIEVLSAQLRDEIANAVETMRPFDLPDIITNSRDGIAARYRLISHSGTKGFDVFNPDGSCGRVQRDWLALTLKVLQEVFDDPELARYLVGMHRQFVL